MIEFEFKGKTHSVEVAWQHAAAIAERVGDPHRILADGGEVGFVQAVRIVAIVTGLPEQELGQHAMKEGAGDIYRAAGDILLATIPEAEDIPETDEKKS